MNEMFRRFLLLTVPVVVMLCGCAGSGSKNMENTNDTLYSGEKFNEHIRSTEARTPAEEKAGFKLPEGFEISLYASEPDIGKPINFAFDAQGRMWVTQSFEYPFPAEPGKGRDRITILEDTDNDGKADKFTHFEDTLNIPIGIMPVKDGAVGWSVPNVYKYTDADGDGKPESTKKLLGPFEVRDTHGMVNNFMIGYDGWIHACHGFTNRSRVAGADGDSIFMVSGNTFRFRPDGSRVEHMTDGRINPFGLTYDELGYLYSTDCHTSPIYQLIRGGDYTQWGKDEGMGFAPDMKPFENEATALAGITYYSDTKFPKEYQGNLYIGDAVSSRVYRNSFTWEGSTPIGKKEEDFILSADPWFRPVSVQIGPDGAIYIADFYNSIIGHYEVPLDHPKRDKIRGRIWRVTYKGKTNQKTDLSKDSVDELLKAFQSENLPVRMMAANQLVDRFGEAAIAPSKTLLDQPNTTAREYIHTLWVLQRLGALSDDIIRTAAGKDDPMIRVHTMRTIAEQPDSSAALYPLIVQALEDKDPHVRRAASELMGRYPGMDAVKTLLGFRKTIPEYDSHLIYTVRLKLRNLLREEWLMEAVAAEKWSREDAQVIATVLPGVETPASGMFLYSYVKNDNPAREELPKAYRHIIRFVPQAQVNNVIATARENAGEVDQEYQIFKNLREGIARRGGQETPAFREWGSGMLTKLINENYRKKPVDGGVSDRLKFSVDLAGEYKVKQVVPQVTEIVRDTAMAEPIRTASLRALMKVDPLAGAALAGELLQNNVSSPEAKRGVVTVLSEFPGAAVNRALAAVQNVTPDLQHGIVLALAGSKDGRDLLFGKVKSGEIFPRALAEPKVQERLLLNISPAQKKTLEELTAGLEAVDKGMEIVIFTRIVGFNNLKERPSPEAGHAVFVKNCSPCHAIKNEGGAIGPQLDGLGKWGIKPIVEKIIDPNRNVSENFRNYTIKMKDGKILSGLYRRDEGEVIIFADAAGQEFAVAKKEIAERTASKYSLMPDQFRNTIEEKDFYALLSYLLAQNN